MSQPILADIVPMSLPHDHHNEYSNCLVCALIAVGEGYEVEVYYHGSIEEGVGMAVLTGWHDYQGEPRFMLNTSVGQLVRVREESFTVL